MHACLHERWEQRLCAWKRLDTVTRPTSSIAAIGVIIAAPSSANLLRTLHGGSCRAASIGSLPDFKLRVRQIERTQVWAHLLGSRQPSRPKGHTPRSKRRQRKFLKHISPPGGHRLCSPPHTPLHGRATDRRRGLSPDVPDRTARTQQSATRIEGVGTPVRRSALACRA
eukprot:81641-Chlamydomonas_euryale.AAC.27